MHYISEYINKIQLNARLIAQLDCLLSFAFISKKYNYVCPKVDSSKRLLINQGRHPVIEQQLETEGSYNKSGFLLMQRPEEYKRLFKYFKPKELGINLNIGHLNLASKAFNFSKTKFVDNLKPYILAIELSHNNGIEDEHLPLKKKGWYWKIIKDPYFNKVYKILEFRNTNIKKIKKTIKLFEN